MIADRGIQSRRRTRPPGKGLRRHALGAVPLAILFMFSLPATGRAEPCPITDPDCLTDPVEETVDKAGKAVTAIVDEGEETVEETEQSVGETVDEVGETVDDVVDQVEAIVGGVIGSPGGDEDGDDPRKDRAKKQPRAGAKEQTRPTDASLGAPRLLRLPDPYVPVSLVRDRDVGSTEPGSAHPDKAIEAAARLAFPVLLGLIIALFLAVQNRIDRSDPKLAGATERPDYLAFQ